MPAPRNRHPRTVTSTAVATGLDAMTADQLRMLVKQLRAKQRLGLYWERDEIEHERALNADHVVATLVNEEAGRRLHVGDAPWEHLLIEGDNFDALRLLRRTHRGQIDVICVDPPYNTGKRDWVYNDHLVRKEDRFRQSFWLEHLYRRFVLARDLLSPRGVLLVFINDENRARLELLLDQVFGHIRVGSFVWRTRQGSNDVTGPRFSTDHEHVLIYGRSEFAFAGIQKALSDYTNDDGDGRGLWASKDLSCGVAYNDPRAGNAYYPLVNPATGIYYPCNPNRVWAYVTRAQAAPGTTFKSYSMDDLIEQRRIKWPGPDDRVVTWHTMDDLLAAIDASDVPKDGRGAPILRRGLPNLEAWVGRPIGFGRPRLKRYVQELDEDRQPLSSWIRPKADRETEERDDVLELTSAYGEEGGQILQAMFAEKVFNYPKPLSLVTELLRQATTPESIVLDFYAGSGTTGHAVMALNAEDDAHGRAGKRRFILVSSTESTKREPQKNLCRDVCARRIALAAGGAAGAAPMPGGMAYLRAVKIAPADAEHDVSNENIWNVLSMRHHANLLPFPQKPINVIVRDGARAVVFVSEVSQRVIDALIRLPEHTLHVYSRRALSVRDALAAAGKLVLSEDSLEAVLEVPRSSGAEEAADVNTGDAIELNSGGQDVAE